MEFKKYIEFVIQISIILAVVAVLSACNSELSDQDYISVLNNNAGSYYADNAQDDSNAAAVPTPTPLATPAPTTSTSLLELDIPDYITILEVQLSTELTELFLSRWGLEDYDIEPLRYMINLTRLDLNHNPISDLSPLEGLTNLTELYMLDNTSTDLSPLANLTNLTSLELSLRDFDDTDLTPLMSLAGLTSFRLSLGGNQTDDISRLAGLTNLTRLDLWHNQISDLTPLAGLTNLKHLDLSFNPVSDITPLANLTNLNTLYLRHSPGIDLSLLHNVPPHVSSPAVSAIPENSHPFADALTSFFVNLTTAGDWGMPYSYHAVLVDVDGQGTPGMVASRWTFEGDRNYLFSFSDFISIYPNFSQRLFFMYNNQLHEVDGRQWGVTPSGRLVAIMLDGACDIFLLEYILLDVNDGRLVGQKSISFFEPTRGDNYYSVNYHLNEFFVRDFEQNQSLTREEFDELMDKHGLYGTSINIWEIPDNSYRILEMQAN